jgi:hypothetical protein
MRVAVTAKVGLGRCPGYPGAAAIKGRQHYCWEALLCCHAVALLCIGLWASIYLSNLMAARGRRYMASSRCRGDSQAGTHPLVGAEPDTACQCYLGTCFFRNP